MIARLASLPLDCSLGERWSYSVAIDVLGDLIETVAGVPLGKFLHPSAISCGLRVRIRNSGLIRPRIWPFSICAPRARSGIRADMVFQNRVQTGRQTAVPVRTGRINGVWRGSVKAGERQTMDGGHGGRVVQRPDRTANMTEPAQTPHVRMCRTIAINGQKTRDLALTGR